MPEVSASLTINLTMIVSICRSNRNHSRYFPRHHGLKMGLRSGLSNHTFMVTDIFAHLYAIIYTDEDAKEEDTGYQDQ